MIQSGTLDAKLRNLLSVSHCNSYSRLYSPHCDQRNHHLDFEDNASVSAMVNVTHGHVLLATLLHIVYSYLTA